MNGRPSRSAARRRSFHSSQSLSLCTRPSSRPSSLPSSRPSSLPSCRYRSVNNLAKTMGTLSANCTAVRSPAAPSRGNFSRRLRPMPVCSEACLWSSEGFLKCSVSSLMCPVLRRRRLGERPALAFRCHTAFVPLLPEPVALHTPFLPTFLSVSISQQFGQNHGYPLRELYSGSIPGCAVKRQFQPKAPADAGVQRSMSLVNRGFPQVFRFEPNVSRFEKE